MGKHKPIFDAAGSPPLFMEPWACMFNSPSFQADCGDYVVVTNAKKVKVSGRKEDQILYRKHTMYPGGLKEIKYKEMMKQKPDEVRKYPSPGDKSHSSSSRSTDHSPGGIWNVA
jgi:large subunit ribosomal protein L13